MGDPKLSEYML